MTSTGSPGPRTCSNRGAINQDEFDQLKRRVLVEGPGPAAPVRGPTLHDDGSRVMDRARAAPSDGRSAASPSGPVAQATDGPRPDGGAVRRRARRRPGPGCPRQWRSGRRPRASRRRPPSRPPSGTAPTPSSSSPRGERPAAPPAVATVGHGPRRDRSRRSSVAGAGHLADRRGRGAGREPVLAAPGTPAGATVRIWLGPAGHPGRASALRPGRGRRHGHGHRASSC